MQDGWFRGRTYPWVVIPLLKAMEGVAETKITQDVKCGEVIPITDVHFPGSLAQLGLIVQAADQKITVPLQDVFLFSQCTIRKGMADDLSLSTMSFRIRDSPHRRDAVGSLEHSKSWLWQLGAGHVNVLPCRGTNEG